MKSKASKRPRVVSESDDDQPLTKSYPHAKSASQDASKQSKAKGKRKVSDSRPAAESDSPSSPVAPNFFRGNPFEARFQSSIMAKTIVYEKTLDFDVYQHSALQNLFVSSGISSMLFPPTVAYPQLIRQFYGNFDLKNGVCTSLVQGRHVELTAKTLGSILSISRKGPCPFTLKGPINDPVPALTQLQIVMENPKLFDLVLPNTSEVPPLAVVVHKILRFNLLPRTGGAANFTYQDLALSALILEGTKFNFASMMLKHMDSCVRQSKKCLPYGGFLTTIFEFFSISFDSEASVSIVDSINSDYLKNSNVFLVNGIFVRTPREPQITFPTSSTPSSSSNPSNSEILSVLHQLVTGQQTLQSNILDIQKRLEVLESDRLNLTASVPASLFRRIEDEFIDLQAGFELQTGAMVEAMQRKINRNSCQLSHEIKFVSNQIGELAEYVGRQTNDLRLKFDRPPRSSTVPEWVRCNWMAEFQGDFLDDPVPPPTHIPRPHQFAHELTPEERAHRRAHRPYFTRRAQPAAHVDDLD